MVIPGKIAILAAEEHDEDEAPHGIRQVFLVGIYASGSSGIIKIIGVVGARPSAEEEGKMEAGVMGLNENGMNFPPPIAGPAIMGAFGDLFEIFSKDEPKDFPAIDIPDIVSWVKNFIPMGLWTEATNLLRRAVS